RNGTKIPQSSVPIEPVTDEAVYEERGDSVERAVTIASSLKVEQDSGLGDQDDASKQERKIDDIDQDAEVTLVDETQGSEKVVEEIVSTAKVSATAIITTEEITLAQALAALKSVKRKVDKDKVETNYELAQRLQAEEQEELTIEEKSKLFQQLLEKRRNHFAAKRAEERRNKPPTKA
ncbi:hypothetical protein Tco_0688744, partial [Tanacetum coccineum]